MINRIQSSPVSPIPAAELEAIHNRTISDYEPPEPPAFDPHHSPVKGIQWSEPDFQPRMETGVGAMLLGVVILGIGAAYWELAICLLARMGGR